MNVRHNSMWERDLKRKKISFVSSISSLETRQSCWNKAVNARKPLWFGGSLTGTRSQGNIEGQWNLMISAQGKRNPAQTKLGHSGHLLWLLGPFVPGLQVFQETFEKLEQYLWLSCLELLTVASSGHSTKICRDGAEDHTSLPQLYDFGQLAQSLRTIFVPSLEKQQLSGRGDFYYL